MRDLVLARFDNAKERLKSAKILLDSGQLRDSVSRSYYCILFTLRAVLAKDGKDFKKHAGVLSYFNQCYFKTKVLDTKYADYVNNAFQIRNNCDYNDFYVISAEDAAKQYEQAKEFLIYIEEFLKMCGALDTGDCP